MMTFEFDSDKATFDVSDSRLDENRMHDTLDRLEKALSIKISRNACVSAAPGYSDPVTRYEFGFSRTIEYSPWVEAILEQFLKEWRAHDRQAS